MEVAAQMPATVDVTETPSPSPKTAKRPRKERLQVEYKPLPIVPGRPKKGGGVHCTPLELFTYWLQTVPVPERNRLTCYVYREWPRLDPTQVLPIEEQEKIRANKGRGGPPINIAKWPEPFGNGFSRTPPINDVTVWQAEMLNCFGCGKYRLMLNDAGSEGGHNIALAFTEQLGDLDSYPPVIKYEHVVRSLPENEVFVRWCRLKGIPLYGDPQTPFENQENEDMAASAEVVREMTGTVNRLVDRITEKPAPAPPAPSSDASTQVQAVAQALTGVMKQQGDMLAQGYDRLMQSRGAEADPMQHTKQVIDLATELLNTVKAKEEKPAAPDPIITALLEDRKAMREEAAALRAALNKNLEDQVTALREEVRTLRTNPQGAVTTNNSATSNPIIETIKALKELGGIKEVISDLFGIAGPEEPTPESKLETILKLAVPAVSGGLANLASIAYNVAQARTGQGKPIPPTDQPQAPTQPRQVTPADLESLQQFLPLATDPIIAAVGRGQDGAVFAAQLLQSTGAQGAEIYRQIHTMGPQQFGSYVAMYSPTLGNFAAQNAERFNKFLMEFLDAPRVEQIYQEAVQQAHAPKVVTRPKPTNPPASSTTQ